MLSEALGNEPVAATRIIDMAGANGISEKTLQRASQAIGVQKAKLAMEAGWFWSLRQKVAKPTEDAQASTGATFEKDGHLRELPDS
jgi:hypothetical protein